MIRILFKSLILYFLFTAMLFSQIISQIEVIGNKRISKESVLVFSELNTGLLDSWYTSIAASGSPGVTTIAEYHEDSHAAYYIVQVEDTTNKQYEMSEVLVVDDGTTNSITEYGNIRSHGSLGSISANIDGSDRKHLTFTPNKNIKVQVKVFQNVLSLVKSTVDTDSIGLDYPDNNAAIESGYATYEGTERDIKRQFGLLHNTKPIFQRFVDGSDSDIVSVSDNTISIPKVNPVRNGFIKY